MLYLTSLHLLSIHGLKINQGHAKKNEVIQLELAWRSQRIFASPFSIGTLRNRTAGRLGTAE